MTPMFVRFALTSLCLAGLGGAVLAQAAPPATPPAPTAPAATLVQAPAGSTAAAPVGTPPSPTNPQPGSTPPLGSTPPIGSTIPDGSPPAGSPPAGLPPATGSAPIAAAPTEAAGAFTTLVPQAGDASDVDEVVLPAKPVLIVSGQSNWEDGLKTMRASFTLLREEAAKAGLQPVGRAVTVFTDATDDGFKYDAMIPLARAPDGTPSLPPDLKLGTTPSGKAYRFVHKGPYDDIDTTYETITAYLDAKDISAKDAFIEEYLSETADPADPNLEVNIFVQPK